MLLNINHIFIFIENETNTFNSSTGDVSSPPTPSTPSTSNNCSLDQFEMFLQTLDNQANIGMNSEQHKIQKDLIFYEQQSRLALSENVIQFWSNQNNTLSKIANIVLAVPCTQVSVERLFSSLKYIFSDQRNRLDPNILEHILLVRANANFNYEEEM